MAKLAMSPTREKYPLSTKKIAKKTLVGALVLGIVFACITSFAVLMMITAKSDAAWIVALGSFVLYFLLVGLIYYYQTWYFATYYYNVNPEYMTIRKGPITPSEINIMYQKIQDVYVDQDLFDRFFGLYDVHIATATFASHNLAHVDGLLKDSAEALRDELLGIFKSKISTK